MALAFLNRMERDQCKPVLSYTMDPAVKAITAVTLTATNNECNAKIPITVTGGVTDTLGFTTEQLGRFYESYVIDSVTLIYITANLVQ